MLKKNLLTALFALLVLCQIASAAETSITAPRGKYQLNFDVTYRINVARGIQTMIELPAGYTFTGTVIGAGYYVAVSELQNSMYITKLAEQEFQTNISFHVLTPEGFEKKLLFRVSGVRNGPKVLAVQFQEPNVSEINAIVREMKVKYDEQVTAKLAEQETALKKSVYDSTVSAVRVMQVKQYRRGKKIIKNKGVSLFVDGVYTSNGDTYIHVVSNTAPDGPCEKLSLTAISKRKNSSMQCTLVKTGETVEGDPLYIFQTSEIPVLKKKKFGKYKTSRYQFHFKIWDEAVKKSYRIS